MSAPQCPGCRPRISFWPGGRAWGHANGCAYDDGQKIEYVDRIATPTQRIERSTRKSLARRHRLESSRTGTIMRHDVVISLRAHSDRCPAHPSEPLYECEPCTREGDR